jgi:hypothetical protein
VKSFTKFYRVIGRAPALSVALAFAACSADKTTTPTSNSVGATRGTMSVSIAPNTIADTVGQRTQLVAAVKDAGGNVVNDCAVEWSTTDTSSIQVSSTGLATAVSPGSPSVLAVCGGATGRAIVAVVPAPAKPMNPGLPPSAGSEPSYASGGGTLLWQDNFDGRGTDAAMLSQYSLMAGESGIHFDATAGLNGSGAARIDWPAQTAAGGCLDDAHLIEHSFTASQEVYVQYSVRYNAGFVFDWIGRTGGPGCVGNAKKLFFLWAGSGQRFDFISENHALGMGSDNDHPLFNQNVGSVVSDEILGDGNWHRITMHVRQSSTPTATDGLIEGWIDGVQRWSWPNIASNASGGWVLFKMPTTFNQGSPVAQSEWFDGLTVWRP